MKGRQLGPSGVYYGEGPLYICTYMYACVVLQGITADRVETLRQMSPNLAAVGSHPISLLSPQTPQPQLLLLLVLCTVTECHASTIVAKQKRQQASIVFDCVLTQCFLFHPPTHIQ